MTLAGIGFLGFSVAFLFVPLLPEIIAAVAEKEGLENSPFLSDKASGIYNSAYGVGNCLAPIIGGAITGAFNDSYHSKTIGFRYCCDIMAFASMGFCIIYIFAAIIPAYISDKRNINNRRDKLIDDLAPTALENSLTMAIDQNQTAQGFGQLNDSNRQTQTK